MFNVNNLLPFVLWLSAAVLAIFIIVVTVHRGQLLKSRSRRSYVHMVSWTMVRLHVMSFIMALLPFPVYMLIADDLDSIFRNWYERVGIFGAIIISILVLAEIVTMYFQARHAMESEMDQRLKSAIGKR
ncbi:hypothetical protein [Bifidobacterium olomucense]|uniref:C4-dicarboxylate ABC transporter n=1 Tax=Bifidobacterium olomucense TaxID=2675324 RepID=A0A7Y0EWZ9_9BIFI|nr:hypothetical protein [Bifidobacterium sp. DSM 109959]NMM97957.1 hypothetical protein [Bifidobacterium sp. DSM 109959]